MLEEHQLQEIRQAYKANNRYLNYSSDRARRVLEEIIEHPRFGGSTDPEVLALLGPLLQIVQPKRVLQLGTYIGFSSVFIADHLARNSSDGHLVTVDPDATAHQLASQWLDQAGLHDRVTLLGGYSTDAQIDAALKELGPFDVIYLDSSHAYQETLKELELIFEHGPWISQNGLLILHDAASYAARWDPTGEGGVRRALLEWVDDHKLMYQFLILEPPLWPGYCGLGFLARRDDSGSTDNGGLHRRVAELEATIAQKNEHIASLETLIRKVEQGRLMRGLRLLHDLVPAARRRR